MESSQRSLEGRAKEQTPAGVQMCQNCQLILRLTVVIATVVLVIGLVVGLALVGTRTAAPEKDPTNKPPGEEPLKQCQRERRDVTLMLHRVTQDSRCGVCPRLWRWWRGHCYFFSVGLEENLRWHESAQFCRRHNSSLAVIEDSAEMDFIQGVMRTFSRLPFLWVGLTDAQQEGRWLWLDGTGIKQYMLLDIKWDADYRDCADLRGGGSLFAVECDAFGPWTFGCGLLLLKSPVGHKELL
ncbi:CD209 antigen-like protein 2 [Genypterus blacodes]|uniref:CD209 antigen-like protein 2 n=1 Tax=Genypterus blacodes TaxID=154954 RepID=UPI003F75A3E4